MNYNIVHVQTDSKVKKTNKHSIIIRKNKLHRIVITSSFPRAKGTEQNASDR